MDIWLIYIIKTLVLPVASLLLCCFFGGFYVIRNKGKGGVFLLTPLICLFLLSLPVVSLFLAKIPKQYLALDYLVVDKVKPQAIVVLGGGSNSYAPEYGVTGVVNTRTLIRLRYTAYLAKKIGLPILVSGGSVFEGIGRSEASLMASVLGDEFNVPVRWLESKSRNTAENALFSKRVLEEDSVNRVVLVTHAMHMNRAVKQFERVGLNVIPAPTSLPSNFELDIFYFLPSASALEMSSMVIHEWLGRVWYSLRYI